MSTYDDDNVNFDDANPPEESNNRTFLIAAGSLGLLILLALLCLGGYFFLSTTSAQRAEQTGIVQVTQQAATIQAVLTQNAFERPTNTFIPSNTPVIAEATATSPILYNPATATVAAAFTQVAVSTQTIIATSTALPNTGGGPDNTPTPATPFTGQVEITYPLEMIVEADDIVTVEIIVNPKLAGLGIHPELGTGVISIETSSQDKERGRLEDAIRLYPVMSAELIAANFDVIPGDSDNRRLISISHSAAWTWSIVARKSGTQKITVNIFGETTFEGEKITILEMSKSRNVTIVEKPVLTRIFDGLASNWVAIAGTGGPLGLLLAYLTYRANRRNEELKSKMEGLEKRLSDLRKAIRRG